MKITNAANEQLTFTHPTQADWQHHSFCLFAGPLERDAAGFAQNRLSPFSPESWTARQQELQYLLGWRLLHAKGEMAVGDQLTGVSIIGSEFHGKILGETKVGETMAIRPQISGRGWVTGTHQHMLDPAIHGPKATALAIPGRVTNEILTLEKLIWAEAAGIVR